MHPILLVCSILVWIALFAFIAAKPDKIILNINNSDWLKDKPMIVRIFIVIIVLIIVAIMLKILGVVLAWFGDFILLPFTELF